MREHQPASRHQPSGANPRSRAPTGAPTAPTNPRFPKLQQWSPSPTPLVDDRRGLVILFDGECGICTRLAHWLRQRDRSGRLLVIPNQRPGTLRRFGVSREQADQAVWLIDLAEDRRLRAAAAINRAMLELRGGWPWVGRMLALPPLLWLEQVVYRLVASQRGRLARWGIQPACDHPCEECSTPDR